MILIMLKEIIHFMYKRKHKLSVYLSITIDGSMPCYFSVRTLYLNPCFLS